MDGRIDFLDDTLLDFLLLADESWKRFSRMPIVAACMAPFRPPLDAEQFEGGPN